jgi:hypothetical protein
MADDKTKRAPQDANLISLTEEYEVEYWTERMRRPNARCWRSPRATTPWPKQWSDARSARTLNV